MTRPIVVSIDQLSRPQPGGIASYVHGLLRGLHDTSHHPTVVPLGPSSAIAALEPELRRHARAVPSWQLRGWRYRPFGAPSGAAVVHATSMMGPFGGGDIVSVALHDLLWRDVPEATTPRGVRFHEQRLQYILGREDIRLLTVSPLLPPRLRALGVPSERIFPVRLGVDESTVTPASPERVREVLAAAGVHGPFTLHAGTREPRKNTQRLVRAHATAVHQHRELGPLVFVGPDGWGAAPTGNAVVLGTVDRDVLLGLYRDAMVVAYVPLSEGFGLPPVEALRAGARVLASNTCPSVADNAELVLVDPLDEDAIADGLITALALRDDEHIRARRTQSVADYSWANCAEDHLRAWS